MRSASALSTHPLATHAVGETVGHLLDAGGPAPEVALVAVTPAWVGALEDIADAARSLLAPATTIGACSSVVIGGERVAEGPAVAVAGIWADGADRCAGPLARPVRLGADGTLPTRLRRAGGTLVLLADPFGRPLDDLADEVAATSPDLDLVGGAVAAADRPGGSRLVLDDAVHTDGAVGVLLSPDVPAAVVAAQGALPIGEPMTVTRVEADGRILVELAGRPALEQLLAAVGDLAPERRPGDPRAVRLGLALRDGVDGADPSDVVLVDVEGAERARGALGLGEAVPAGATVQFHLRDGASVGEDTGRLLEGRRPVAGWLFTDPSRTGAGPVGTTHVAVDASRIVDAAPDASVAGLGCVRQVATICGRPRTLDGCAAGLLVGERAGRPLSEIT